MKKIAILIALLVITVTNVSAQDLIDPLTLPTHPDTTIDFNNTNIFDKGWNDFINGWNYGGLGRQFDQLMNSNFYLHGWQTGENLFWADRGSDHRWYLTIYPLNQPSDVSVCVTQALVFEPSIEVNETQKSDAFTPTANHTEGAVFGFQYKHPNIINSGGKSVINPTVVTTQPVLSDVWPKNELKFWNDFYLCYHNLRDEL